MKINGNHLHPCECSLGVGGGARRVEPPRVAWCMQDSVGQRWELEMRRREGLQHPKHTLSRIPMERSRPVEQLRPREKCVVKVGGVPINLS